MDFIKRAKASGADIRICNCSWQVLQNSKALDAAVTELGESGIVTLFAAGNDAQDLNAIQHIQSTLADNPYAIIVASTDVAGNLADSSSAAGERSALVVQVHGTQLCLDGVGLALIIYKATTVNLNQFGLYFGKSGLYLF